MRNPDISNRIYVTSDGIAAARRGDRLHGLIDDIVPGAAPLVITTALAPLFVYNIQQHEGVMVTFFSWHIATFSDDCQFTIGYTTLPDGAGVFFPIIGHQHLFTGAAIAGTAGQSLVMDPPAFVTYASGARSITALVDANDATCEIGMTWLGWRERV